MNNTFMVIPEDSPPSQLKGPKVGIRHLQVLLIFLCIVSTYMARLNISVSLVAMTNANTTNPNFREFKWNEKHKSYILSSFYWGYVLMQFPGGVLARRFGSKVIMFMAALLTACLSLAIPYSVDWGGWQIYCAIRVLLGFAQGVLFPCIHHHLARWSPPAERTFLGALAHSGIECGNVIAIASSGIIAESSLGWPGISYISGGCCFVWCALCLVFVSNNPTESCLISARERNYIESSLKHAEGFHRRKFPIPWRAIFTSTPFLCLLVARGSHGWGFSTVQMQTPSYMRNVLQLNIKENAFFSALPYMTMWMMAYVHIGIAQMLQQKQLLSLTAMRKIFNTTSLSLPACCLIGIGFLDPQHKALVISLFALAVGLNAGVTIGCTLNTLDLSPNNASVLMGLTNVVSNTVQIFMPLLIGVIVSNEKDRQLWQTAFIVSAAGLYCGNFFFLIGGSTKTQPWDDPDFMVTSTGAQTISQESSSGQKY